MLNNLKIYEFIRFRDHNGKRPTLVIDLMGFINVLSQNKLYTLCGSRHQLHAEKVKDVLTALARFADIKCFIDGAISTEKLKDLIVRHNANYKRDMEVIQSIDKKIPLQEIVDKLGHRIRSTLVDTSLLKTLAIEHCELIIAENAECDVELAKYANDHPSVLAVLADDSDFLIFPGSWRYFSLKEFNVDLLTTKEYSRTELRRFLELDDQQLKILPTIAGSSIIKFEEVQQFLHGFSKKQINEKYLRLARYIKESLPKNFDDLVKTIARNVTRVESVEMKNRIEASLKFYNYVSLVQFLF